MAPKTNFPAHLESVENAMNNERMNNWKVYIACIIGHVFWGFSFFASRTALNIAHVFVLLSHRFLIANQCLAFVVSGRDSPRRGKHKFKT